MKYGIQSCTVNTFEGTLRDHDECSEDTAV